ncbi:phospholipid transporting ATPase, partial [Spiromyces aspiralis]
IIEFFTILAICHTVLAEYADIDNNPHRVEYKAQSPDEAALVAAARDVGFVFLGREQYHDNTEHSSASPKTALSCEFLGQPQKFILLNVLEFTSARKRMSVIVRRPEDNKIFMFTKGADNVIIERLRVSQDSGAVDSETWKQQRELKEKTLEDLETFATNGFRTLCLAYRV